MNNTLKVLLVSGAIVTITATLVSKFRNAEAVTPVVVESPLLDFVQQAIAASKPELSATRIKVITSILTNIATEVFETRSHREYWVALIGIESRYIGKSKSTAGAIGLGQLLPQYKDDFGKTCGMSPVSRDDIDDDYTNAYLSACYFNQLIKQYNGNIPLALAAYNSGMNSKTTANAKTGGKMAAETETYIRKVWIKTETANTSVKEVK